ncbi:MAG TPA: FAD-dependent tricarballylate dehydrogenase TcuA [Streptosporangiaceae bacterium]|nr:FAD-dependent tricarballylate dehydrogenase TcuA [Streptosporangiaceae bacterium]
MTYDVIVVGGGNAGFCAAHAAAERGRRVIVLEKGPLGRDGGNSYYTAGAFRVTHEGLADLAPLLTPDPRHTRTVLHPYRAADFHADMRRLTGGRADPELTRVLVSGSRPGLAWLAGLGARFRLMYERQAYADAAGAHVFWGGLAVATVDGGKGLVATHRDVATRLGETVAYGCQVTGLVLERGEVVGVRYVSSDDGSAEQTMRGRSVVLAAGGFEASPELRARYLGGEWAHTKVRGNPLNTGEVLLAAIEAGAAPAGDWGSCHSTAWDAAAAESGDRELTNQLTRQSYPLGLIVNKNGERFVDEGADFRNYTYARYGREILRQPGGLAFQIFDAATRPLLRPEEYDNPAVTCAVADTIPDLGAALGIDPGGLDRTVKRFNGAVDRDIAFDPAVKDGKAARDIDPPKSNWAVPVERPPFYGFPVTCGITFTFGGLRIDADARVLRGDGRPIPGLYACGELVGGLFSGNYPGGSGLTAGMVFGYRAGAGAAAGGPA